jgi:hypothetical protein
MIQQMKVARQRRQQKLELGGHLAPAQNRAKTKNQLAHDSEARALPLQSVDDLRLLVGQLGAYKSVISQTSCPI